MSSEATVSGAVEAMIGERSTLSATSNIPSINVGTGKVLVRAGATMTASRDCLRPRGWCPVGISILLPTATVSGATRAYVRDGVSMIAGSLVVLAGADNPTTVADEAYAVNYRATATTSVVGVGVIGGAGANADATVSGVMESFVGAPALIGAGGASSTRLQLRLGDHRLAGDHARHRDR